MTAARLQSGYLLGKGVWRDVPVPDRSMLIASNVPRDMLDIYERYDRFPGSYWVPTEGLERLGNLYATDMSQARMPRP